MHLSKRMFYIGIIGYSGLLLWMWDFWAGIATTGNASYAFLGKMVVDIAFILAAGWLMFGPTSISANDEDIGEMMQDLHISDSALFGLFGLNLLGNGGYHAFLYANTTGVQSSYYLIWTLGDIMGIFITAMLWRHAVAVQKRKARKAQARAQQNQGGPTNFRQAS